MTHDDLSMSAAMINERTSVQVRDLALDLQIGLLPHEYGRAQRVRVWIDVDLKPDWRLKRDGFFCYATLQRRVKALEKEPHVVLMETLAETIAAICLEDDNAERATVRVEKPRVTPDAEGCSVTRIYRRGPAPR